MERDADCNIIKAENGKELKFSEATEEFKSGKKIYTWRLQPADVKIRYVDLFAFERTEEYINCYLELLLTATCLYFDCSFSPSQRGLQHINCDYNF